MLRFADATDDQQDARVDAATAVLDGSPVAGFLLPDHADEAVELFDGAGRPLGQVFHRGVRREVTWEGVPGQPGPLGGGPEAPADAPGALHLVRLAVALVQRDAIERATAPATTTEALPETALGALLRVVDTTTWTMDPFGSTGLAHRSQLVGRPIAVVRARLRLELRDDVDASRLPEDLAAERAAVFAAVADRAFPVRLGSLTQFDDGLLGCFVDDDYSVFHPVHAAVLAAARPGGPQRGFLAGVSEAAEFGRELPIEEIDHPYVKGHPVVPVRVGQTVRLTLLMLPGHAVHATSGVLPRKRLELNRTWIAEPLERMLPSFRVGPVLLDPATVRMPRASGLPDRQAFTWHDTPSTWRDDPILAASGAARLPDEPAVAEEGWIRLAPESSTS
jgi:hypothetical protein